MMPGVQMSIAVAPATSLVRVCREINGHAEPHGFSTNGIAAEIDASEATAPRRGSSFRAVHPIRVKRASAA
jgi:hypothetical protein